MQPSFKVWYDSQSELVRKYLYDKLKDSHYFNFDTEDYYKHNYDNPDNLILKNDLNVYSNTSDNMLIAYIVRTLDKLNHSLEVKEALDVLKENVNKESVTFGKYFGVTEHKKQVRAKCSTYSTNLEDVLFYTTDYDNIDWSNVILPFYHPALVELFGKEMCLERYKNNINYMRQFITSLEIERKQDVIFDTLFFGEDGWTEEQKKQFICSFSLDAQTMDGLCYYIFSVDISYIRYLTATISNDWASTSNICQVAKDNRYYSSTKLKEDEYRYNKLIRQMLYSMYACSNKKLNKLTIARLGDIAGMIKLYNFDLNTVLDSCIDMFNEEIKQLTI